MKPAQPVSPNASFPELLTHRFRLRRIVETDLDHLLLALSDPQVNQYYGVSFYDNEGVRHQLNWYDNLLETGTGIWWAICTKEDPALIGAIGINNLSEIHRKAETGFWLLPALWKQGVIAEAFQPVLDYAFRTLKLHRLEAWVETGNAASMKVLEKQGFRKEGTLVDCEVKNDQFISLHIYARLNPESVDRSRTDRIWQNQDYSLISQQYQMIRESRAVLLDYCAKLTPDHFMQENSAFGRGGSIRNLLVHIANTYQFWIGKQAMQWDMKFTAYEEIASVGAVEELFGQIDSMVEEFIHRFASNPEEEIDFEIQGKTGRAIAYELFSHAITHEFHHKGQILSISRQLNYIPVDTDIMR